MTRPTTARRRGAAGFFTRLYTGTGAFDIVGRRKLWYVLFGTLVLVCVGVDRVPRVQPGHRLHRRHPDPVPGRRRGRAGDVEHVRGGLRAGDRRRSRPRCRPSAPGTRRTVLIRSEPLDAESDGRRSSRRCSTRSSRSAAAGRPGPEAISDSAVSGTWGGQITRQALIALAVFLVLVTIFLAFYFERAMAVAALVALRPRRRRDGGRLLDRRVRGHPVHGDRPADDPGLLALRHGRGVRQGQGEHPRAARADPPHLRRGGQPRAQPDADALDQHLADRGAAGGRADGRRRRAARGRHPGRPGARADGRHHRRRARRRCCWRPRSWSTSRCATRAIREQARAGRRPPGPAPRRAGGRPDGAERRPTAPSRTWPTTTCWPPSCAGSARWPPRPASRPVGTRARRRRAGEPRARPARPARPTRRSGSR